MSRLRVELQTVPQGGSEYQTVATLAFNADGTHELHDPDSLFPFEVPVPVFDDGAARGVNFEDEPLVWARNLPNLLRTGYLVPRVTEE